MASLTGTELFLLSLLVILAVGCILADLTGSPADIWSPRMLFTVIILYYIVVGPLLFIVNDSTVKLGVDYRSLFWKGWLAGLIAYMGFLIGYSVPKYRTKPPAKLFEQDRLYTWMLIFVGISVLSLLIWALLMGQGLDIIKPTSNPDPDLAGGLSANTNPFIEYFEHLGGLIIPAMVIMLILWLESRSRAAGALLMCIFPLAIGYYLHTGFRYRIAWMALSFAAAYYLTLRRRPNIIAIVIAPGAVLMFIMSMGAIGNSRTYYGGLSFDRISDTSSADLFESGMAESGIFMTLCIVIDSVPSRLENTYFDPFIIAAIHPIPSRIWLEKPRSTTLQRISESFGDPDAVNLGQAVPYFGEWYIAFWWPGVVVSSFIFGNCMKRVWLWYRENEEDNLVRTTYCVVFGYMHIFFSRGYLAAQLLFFCSTILPLIIIYRSFLKEPEAVIFEGGDNPTDSSSTQPTNPQLDSWPEA